MSFTDIFIKRPVLAIVVSLLILLMGLQAFLQLSVREFPEIELTSITVTTTYPGATQDAMRSFITTPLQQSVASAEGIDSIQSTSSPGVSTITIQLKTDADPDRAMTDVSSKVNAVRYLLPREANDPVISREESGGGALMYYSFDSDTLTQPQVNDYLVRVIQPAIQAVDGVGSAQILGGQNFAMRIWLDPKRMAALDVTATDVNSALIANNVSAAPGNLKSGYVETSVRARTDLATEDDFRALVVANRDGRLVQLRDIATVALGPENVDVSSFAYGKRAIFLAVNAVPGGNALDLIPRVRDRMDELVKSVPPGIKVDLNWDASRYIQGSINEVVKTVIEASLIVVIIVYLFLGNIRSTIIPIIAIPLSLIGVLFLLQTVGFSINLLTLLALVLAIGLVVDDAIVVVENIQRHIEEGQTPMAAALQGAREIALPVIAMTITLAAVYAPILLITGLTGQLFREFAFTLAAAVVISGIVALTLSPMMCAHLLKSREDEAREKPRSRLRKIVSKLDRGFSNFIEPRFEALRLRYARSLASSLASRGISLAIGAILLLATVMFYTRTPAELAPAEDQGFLFIITSTPDWTNIDYIDHYVAQYHGIFKKFPEYRNSFLINGVGSASTGFGGFILKPWDERSRTTADILPEVSQQLSQLSGTQSLIFNLPSLPTPGGGPPVQFVVKTLGSYQDLAEGIARLQAEAAKSGLFIFTDTSLKFSKPQAEILIDRAKANQMGVRMQDIADTLSTLMGGNYVNLFEVEGRSYRVIPQVARVDRLNAEAMTGYYVRARNDVLVPLSSFVTVRQTVEPNSLTTFQQLNSATLSGVPMPGRSLGEALDFLQEAGERVLGPSFSFDTLGESRQYIQEGDKLAIVFGFALIVIFLVLAAQFESFRDPIIILVTVPLSLAGALLALNIGSFFQTPGASINIYTQIGLLTLAGLISKHGILMVDFANQLQRERGLDKFAAITEAASIRLRPILMTTAAMVAGVVPLLLATGAGAASRFAIGLIISSGLLIGTMLTLFVLPAIYTWLAGDHRVPAQNH